MNRLFRDVEAHLAESVKIAEATEATRLLVAENTLHISELIKSIDRLVRLHDEMQKGGAK